MNGASEQCDQIWHNFATLAKNINLWQCLKGLFAFWISFKPILAQLFCIGANFHFSKWPNIEKQSWHLVTLRVSHPVIRRLNNIYILTKGLPLRVTIIWNFRNRQIGLTREPTLTGFHFHEI